MVPRKTGNLVIGRATVNFSRRILPLEIN